ncbi:MAG: transmembrane anchor protein [Thiobacillus sp.]|nr:transmembrane anchor protein [Thiobacillus sp.]
MYNSDTPLRAELPSSKQLLRSTILAAIAALVLLIAVVLPAEYGIDPTGAGRALRLTEMGDIKQQLAAEAAADAAAAAPAAQSPAAGTLGMATASAAEPPARAAVAAAPKVPAQAAAPKIAWRDEIPLTLAPGEGMEIKLKMAQGAKAQYAWVVEGGEVNFDTHGDAPGKSISYEKGRGVSSDAGVLEAAFTGNHGWYWRNRGQSSVTVILRTRGDYTEIKKML